MIAITIQPNKTVSNGVKDNWALPEPSYGKNSNFLANPIDSHLLAVSSHGRERVPNKLTGVSPWQGLLIPSWGPRFHNLLWLSFPPRGPTLKTHHIRVRASAYKCVWRHNFIYHNTVKYLVCFLQDISLNQERVEERGQEKERKRKRLLFLITNLLYYNYFYSDFKWLFFHVWTDLIF